MKGILKYQKSSLYPIKGKKGRKEEKKRNGRESWRVFSRNINVNNALLYIYMNHKNVTEITK